LQKYVIESNNPFLVTVGYGERKGQAPRAMDAQKPLGTIVSTGKHALVLPHLTKYHGLKGNEARGQEVNKPILTVDTQNRFGLACAFLSKYYTGVVGSKIKSPMPTVTAIDHNALVATHLTKFYGTNIGSDMRQPVPTVTATGQHIGEVRAFLVKYYGCGYGQSVNEPLHTIVSKDRFGLVTVAGQKYQIADIGLRMLAPRELATAQGFPASYILAGTKSCQVAKIGNSVCPPIAEALVRANVKLLNLKTANVG
jgi:DNA (cytosine-5)-methyltransferase 1